MYPITTAIIAALSAGVTGGITAVGKNNNISKTITDLEADPESKGRQLLLAEQIETADANLDSDILKVAQKLTEALQSAETGRKAIARFQVDARNAQIGIIGDRAKVEGGIHFGEIKR